VILTTLETQGKVKAGVEGRPNPTGVLALAAALLLAGLLASCGRYRPAPVAVDPEAYRAVSVADLKAPRAAGLAAGDKIKVEGYFWEYLRYDPAMLRNYLTMLRHPVSWSRLEWFAVYGTPQMREHFDRMAMDPDQRRSCQLKRLDPLLIYGELASMGGGLLYFRVHRIQKLEEE
jgi:hypothetical protein